MLKFNIVAAKKAGFTDKQITEYLAKNPQTANVPQTTTAAVPQQNRIAELLPLLGSILGGTVGAPFGPAGLIAGSGIGGGLGEFGRQAFGGEQISGGKILGEAGLGAAGGGLGVLLGGATKAARGAKVAQAGTKLAAKPYASEAIRALPKATRNIAARATEIGETAATLKGLTAPAKLTTLGKTRQSLNVLLENITQKQLAETPVAGGDLLNVVKNEAAASAVDLSSGAGKTAFKFWGAKIGKLTSLDELSKLNETLLNKIAKVGIKTQSGQILKAIQSPVGTHLNTLAGTEDIFAALSKLNAAEPIIAKQAGKVSRLPFGLAETGIPQRTQEALQASGGAALGRFGQVAGAPITRQIGGQAGARALFGGGGVAEQYQETEAEPTMAEQYTQQKPAGLNITAQQVALARLTLPDKQADAIEAAYKILNPSGATSASQEFLDKAVNNVKVLQSGEQLGYGPVAGRLYELQLGALGGAGTPTEVTALNQRYNLLKLNILRAYQGARISDKDFELARLYIPNISDTEATAKTKLQILNDILLSAEPPTQKGAYEQTD